MLERPAMDLLDTKRPRALLVAFCLLVWLPGFFTLPPTDRDESRFAQASKQMLESGDYVRIMNGTEPRNRKPIGIYWLQVPFAAAAHGLHIATGNPVWPYRIPSVLGGLIAVLATFEAGLALTTRRTALLAAAMLAASVILVAETHLAKTDAALLGATAVAMAVLARAHARLPVGRGQAAVFWLAIGAGILLKGPIAPMVAGLTALTLVCVERQARWLLVLRPASGLPLLFAVIVPWFVAIGFATHGAFFTDAVGGDLGRKLAGGDDAHGAPPGLHLLLLPLLAFPATLPVIGSLPRWWRERRLPAHRFLLSWIVPSWLVFEVVPTKLPHYTLPLYPAVFVLAAALIAQPAGWWTRRGSGWVTMAVTAVLAAGALALPLITGAAPLLGVPACVAVILVGWLALRRDRPALGLVAMPFLTSALLGFELPAARPLWVAPAVARSLRPGDTLASVGFHEPSLMFLAGTTTVLAATGLDGARALARGDVTVVSVAIADRPSFLAEAARLGLTLDVQANIHGFNYSRGRRTDLAIMRGAPPP